MEDRDAQFYLVPAEIEKDLNIKEPMCSSKYIGSWFFTVLVLNMKKWQPGDFYVNFSGFS